MDDLAASQGEQLDYHELDHDDKNVHMNDLQQLLPSEMDYSQPPAEHDAQHGSEVHSEGQVYEQSAQDFDQPMTDHDMDDAQQAANDHLHDTQFPVEQPYFSPSANAASERHDAHHDNPDAIDGARQPSPSPGMTGAVDVVRSPRMGVQYAAVNAEFSQQEQGAPFVVLHEEHARMQGPSQEPGFADDLQIVGEHNLIGHHEDPERILQKPPKKKRKKGKRKSAKVLDVQHYEQKDGSVGVKPTEDVNSRVEHHFREQTSEYHQPYPRHGNHELELGFNQDDVWNYDTQQRPSAETQAPADMSRPYDDQELQTEGEMHNVGRSATPAKNVQHILITSSPTSQLRGEMEAAAARDQTPCNQNYAPQELHYQDGRAGTAEDLHSRSMLGYRQLRQSATQSSRAATPEIAPAYGHHGAENGRMVDAPRRDVVPTPVGQDSGFGNAMRQNADNLLRLHQAEVAQREFELQQLHQSLEQERASAQSQEERAQELQQEVHHLSEDVDRQKAKLAGFEMKANKFKIFVDGLGNDFASLKKESDADRARSAELVHAAREQAQAHESSLESLRACANKATQLKDQALKACSNAVLELEKANVRCAHLEEQLNDKSQLLDEEKNLRSQIQGQLTTAVNANEGALQEVKAGKDAALEKLSEIRAELVKAQDHSAIIEVLDKVNASIQSLTSQPTASPDDVSSVKALVEALSQNITTCIQEKQNDGDQDSANKTYLEEALEGLKADLDKREQTVAQDAVDRAAIARLQQQLNESEARMSQNRSDLEKAQNSTKQLQEQNDSLHAQIAESQERSTQDEAAVSQLNVARDELRSKTDAINSAQAELDRKSEELHTLTTINAALRDELKVHEDRLALPSSPSASADAEDFARKLEEEVQRVRQEISEQATAFNESEDVRRKNELRQLQTSSDRMSKKLKEYEQRSAKDAATLDKTQKQYDVSLLEAKEKLAAADSSAESHKREAASVQSSLDALRHAVQIEKVSRGEYDAINVQLMEEQVKARTAEANNIKLQNEINQLRADAETVRLDLDQRSNEVQRTLEELEQAKNALELAKDAFDKQHAAERNSITHLENQLGEAQELSRMAGEGLEQYKRDSKAHLAKEQEQAQKAIADLQTRLAEAEQDVSSKTAADEEFRSQVQQSWEQEQSTYKANIAQAEDKVNSTIAERDRALAEVERLRNEISTMHHRANTSYDADSGKHPDQNMSQAPNEHSGRDLMRSPGEQVVHKQGPKLDHGITPTASIETAQPTRPRKVVDRGSVTTTREDSIPAPEVLRPRSADTSAGGTTADQSQSPFARQPLRRSRLGPESYKQGGFAPNSSPIVEDSQPPTYSHAWRNAPESQQPLDIVPETQYDDLPSFAQFKAANSSLSKPADRQVNPGGAGETIVDPRRRNRDPMHHPALAHQKTPAEDAFISDTQDAHRDLEDDIGLKLPDFEFKKPVPASNSGSKLVRTMSEVSSRSRDIQEAEQASYHWAATAKTPEPRPTARGVQHDQARTMVPQSSSPDFMLNGRANRPMNTYSGHSSGGRKRIESNSALSALKHLPAKRKTNAQIFESYDSQRQKRLRSESAAPPSTANTQQEESQETHPSFSQVSAFPRSSQGVLDSIGQGPTASQSQNRVRTLAGASARQTRGSKKRSTDQEINARFAQELKGR